ncbi:MAG: ACP S-malonyltransferase [candidate division Zixibacteria bacterium]|jgi:[acyl-carrier-protein] S-malonyltransferase|nr:ACP S-malonyltransferase [candidate division Zixibacteria bacterium]
MNKTALFFPGQASQYIGMGKDLYDHSAEVRRLYELASDEIGEDIARLSFDGPAEELKRTRFTQPAILLHSLAVLSVMESDGVAFDYAAGHSLGEYGALAVCGALSFEDAVRAVVRRAALMEDACVANPGTMAAVMGLSEEQIADVCRQASSAGIVVPANYNSDAQIVVSGAVAGVEKAAELARQAGAKRAIVLEVGGAFHSPLMEPAREGLESYLADVAINAPARPVIANVTADEARDGAEIRRLLVQQITAPVRWAQTMTFLRDRGVTRIIEIGPGKVLTGLARREMKPEQSINLDRLEDIHVFAAANVEN